MRCRMAAKHCMRVKAEHRRGRCLSWALGIAALVFALLLSVATTAAAPQLDANYQAGWNLIAGTEGTEIIGVDGPLYTTHAGSSGYVRASAGTVLGAGQRLSDAPQAGVGYWGYFPHPTTISLTSAVPRLNPGAMRTVERFLVVLPAGEWIMVGNPYSLPVTATGADVLYAYTPDQGYAATTTLQPGRGAFAYSATGATLTVCPVQDICG